jgi:hypothetical protein
MLFVVASVPYLWHIQSDADKVRLFTYLGWEYVLGSLLFLFGGAVNYLRRQSDRPAFCALQE